MKDDFEKYVEGHRNEFDVDEPRNLWGGIQAEMLRKKYQNKLNAWRIAASVAILFAVSHLGFDVAMRNMQPSATPQNTGAFASLEVQYEEEVENLEKEVKQKGLNKHEYATLFEQLAYIDKIENEYRADIPLGNNKEKIAEILVDTYEKKIRLLERLLEEADRNEKLQNELKQL